MGSSWSICFLPLHPGLSNPPRGLPLILPLRGVPTSYPQRLWPNSMLYLLLSLCTKLRSPPGLRATRPTPPSAGRGQHLHCLSGALSPSLLTFTFHTPWPSPLQDPPRSPPLHLDSQVDPPRPGALCLASEWLPLPTLPIFGTLTKCSGFSKATLILTILPHGQIIWLNFWIRNRVNGDILHLDIIYVIGATCTAYKIQKASKKIKCK